MKEKSKDLSSWKGHWQLRELAQEVIARYGLPRDARVRLVSRSENETWKVEASGGRSGGRSWALRLQRPGYQTINSLASEISWLVALRHDGVVATPVPVAGVNGEWVQYMQGPTQSRTMVLFEWEKGREPEIGMDLRQCFKSLGAITAQMHNHSRKWRRPAGFERFAWNFDTALGETPRWGDWRRGLGMDAERRDLFGCAVELIRQRLEAYGTGPARFGLAHCDQRLANLLVHGDEIKVIDFDDCGFSWYMYDAAASVSFYEHLPQAPTLIDQWLEGYQLVSSLSREEVEEIPTFVMLRRILLVAWIGSHPEADLARSLGSSFTDQTVGLCSAYLRRFG
jgi:Ser/Thr protein kinase RdoA (MazF antagonist)